MRLPLVGALVRKAAVMRATRTLRDLLKNGVSLEYLKTNRAFCTPKRMLHLEGQPPEVKRAYEDAMGFKMEDW